MYPPRSNADPHAIAPTRESLLGKISNVLEAAIFLHDADTGAIIEVNDTVLRLFGYSRDEILALDIADLSNGAPPYDQIHAREKVAAAMERGPQTFEWQSRRKNGELFWTEVTLSRVVVEGAARVLAVARELPEVASVTEEGHDRERLLAFTQFTVDQAKMAVFWCHSDGSFFYVNDTACEWLGYPRGELLKMHIADINPEFPRESWDTHWRAVRSKGLLHIESLHQRRNGEIYPVEIYSSYVRFEGGEYKLSFVNDITERKREENERLSLEERLRHGQKMEAIGTLAGGVAHDLNNLLSPILGYSEMLEGELPDGDPRRAWAEEIHGAGSRARDLTRQLLSFGRKQALEMQVVNPNDIISNLGNLLARTIREDIAIHENPAANLPPIAVDVGQLEQVIINLAINAQDAMPDGGTLTIRTRAATTEDVYRHMQPAGQEPGPSVLISVSDTGQGMDQDVLDHVFEPFFTTKAKGKGTGLGLATAYGIVSQHGGTIWATSEPGKGSTFCVCLPQAADPEQPAIAESNTPDPERGTETVLVVEDNDAVLRLTTELVDSFGYTVLSGGDPAAALALADEHPGTIDLLLTDVIMPDRNGKVLFEELAALRPDLRVLYMSGYTDDVIAPHGVIDASTRFLQKPFTAVMLAAKIREALDDD